MSKMEFESTMPTILCCVCGIDIQQNPANMCVTCLRANVDITDSLPRQLSIHQCRNCLRFLCPPWQTVALESKELLAACLRKIPALSKLKLIDAVWIWTEPHSLRLNIKLTVQKEVMNGAVLQQAAVVEFTIRNQQCKDCQMSFATGAWHAVVQVRQRVSHKRTFFFLEQLLLKHNAHSECINIVTFRDGMDFYFTEKQRAVRFIDFLEHHVPTKTKYARKLVTADHTSNVGEFKHNFIVEIVPICKDDLVILPKDLARNLSDMSPLALVKAVAAEVHVVDPLTGDRAEVSTEKYWRYEFGSVMTSRQLVKFVVLAVEPMLATQRAGAKQRGVDRKLRLAEVVLARERDFGVNDTQLTCVTHLGNILREGDVVYGYDLVVASWANEREAEGILKKKDLPDVVLVRKCYKNKGDRIWELKNLHADEEVAMTTKEREAVDEDYEEFLQEIEGDKEMRANINLYKANKNKNAEKGGKTQKEEDDGDDEKMDDGDDDKDEEEIRLDELLDELSLSMAAAGQGLSDSNGNDAAAIDGAEARILTADEAAAVAPVSLPTSSGFDASDFDSKDFKFV